MQIDVSTPGKFQFWQLAPTRTKLSESVIMALLHIKFHMLMIVLGHDQEPTKDG